MGRRCHEGRGDDGHEDDERSADQVGVVGVGDGFHIVLLDSERLGYGKDDPF